MLKSFTEFTTNASLTIGDEKILEAFKNPNEVGLFTFIWTRDQGAELIIDGVPIIVNPHQIVSLTPIQTLQFIGGASLFVYQFNREFYCIKDHDEEVSCVGLLFFGNREIPIVSLDSEEQQKFFQLHQVFLDELEHTGDNIQAEMLHMLMARFIMKTTRLLKASDATLPQQQGKLDLLRNFNLLVETHFKEEHSVRFYAEKLFKSPKTLSNSFGKINRSPLKIIHERIILEAKRLLMYSDKTAKEIAYEIGFEDASHLSRMFKKLTGLAPSEFKIRFKNNA
ncbi:MAG: helix-turn-helix domain-containing protein [Bacteroidota bacterium]